MPYKQPRSVQIIIFAEGANGREFLLLKRVPSHGGFWQSVTGSLEEAETHKQAAVREVMEETAIRLCERDLINLDLVNRFEIAPNWRGRYAPGVTHNEEVCFAARVDKCEVTIDSLEHQGSAWVDYDTALGMLYWDSNKRAFAALGKLLQ